jgi:hypothetical protein
VLEFLDEKGVFVNRVERLLLFNGKQEKLDEIIYLEILFTRPRQNSATPYPLAAELDPGILRRRPKGLKIESQGVEEKENSFNVQIQIFNM